MASGIHSTVRSLETRLQVRWAPKWHEAFRDPRGGFYERLGKGFKPVLTGQRRLVAQCRQLSIYAHASLNDNKGFKPDLKKQFEFIMDRYYDNATGLWHFALDDDGQVVDKTCDLYALAFVIFACSHYYRATGDERAEETAGNVLRLIDARFAMPLGLAEALGPDSKPLPRVRRQNPHMHLLEACLFAQETWGGRNFEAMADEMVSLFQSVFFDSRRGTLTEFFTDDLKPHPEMGDHLEPGHYFEWVWLLKKHGAMKGAANLHDPFCLQLLVWANEHGWDEQYGGIYDIVSSSGYVISGTKRIWPFCEALKANALMLEAAPNRQDIKDRVTKMVGVFESKYMQERGFWTESLNRDLTPAADFMPATTPYHVYFGITETWDVMQKRGAGKSLGSALQISLYRARRSLSSAVKTLRTAF